MLSHRTYLIMVLRSLLVLLGAFLLDITNLQAQLSVQIIATDTTVCGGQEAKLFAFGGANYIWKNDAGSIIATNTNTITVHPSQTTTYTVMGTVNNAGTMESASLAIAVLPPPQLLGTPPDALTACLGTPLNLQYTLANPIAGYQIHTIGATYNNDIQTANTLNFAATLTAANGRIVVTFSDENGCTVQDTVSLIPAQNCVGDTTIIIVVPPGGPTDTCLTAIIPDFPTPVDTAYLCSDNPNIEVILNDTTSCITIIPDDDFLGTDTLCVVHCNDAVPPVCDTTIIVVIVEPPTTRDVDTIYVSIPGGVGPTQVCLTEILSFDGAIGNVGICHATPTPVSVTTFEGSACLSLYPLPEFVGSDTLCVVHCSATTNICDTTYIIVNVTPNDGTPTVVTDTIAVTIPGITPTEVCVGTALDLAGPVISVNVCADDANTVDVVLQSIDGCVWLDPNDSFVGTDTVCIIFCDNSVPQICDTTYIIVTVLPPPNVDLDTLRITLPNVNTTLVCLDDYIDLPNPPAIGFLCDSDENIDITTTDSLTCLNLNPNDGFSGVDTLCYVFCDNGTPQTCDTTYIIVTVLPPSTPDNDTLRITIPEIISTNVCLDDFINLPNPPAIGFLCDSDENIDITTTDSLTCLNLNPNDNFLGTDTLCYVFCDNGTPQTCDTTYIIVTVVNVPDTVVIVVPPVITSDTCLNSILSLPDNIVSWSFCENAVTSPGYTLSLDSLGCLHITPDAGFTGSIQDTVCLIICHEENDEIICDSSGIVVVIVIPPIDAMNIDTLYTVISSQYPTTYCVDGLVNLPAGLNNTYVCGEDITTIDVSINPDSLNCVTLTPAPGFVGVDTACVLFCDQTIPSCVLTYIVITVLPPPDTLIVPIAYFSTDTICIDEALEFPAPVMTSFFCNVGNPATVSIAGLDGLTCLIAQSAEGFYGVSPDTICYITCYDVANTICDTTYIVFVVTDPCAQLFPERTLILTEEMCTNDSLTLCTNIPVSLLETVILTDNGVPFTGPFTTCNDTLVGLTLPEGAHQLIVNNAQLNCADTLDVIVVCGFLQIDTTVFVGTTDTLCLSDYGITGPYVSITNTCPEASGTEVSFQIDPLTGCIIYTGLATGIDTACLEICFPNDICINVLVIVNAIPECFSFIVQETATAITQDCAANASVCINFPFDLISDYTITNPAGDTLIATGCNNGLGSAFELPVGEYPLYFRHNITGCQDTVTATIACISPDIVIDTILIGAMDTFCVDTSQLIGNFVSLTNICPEESGTNVLFTIIPNTNCVIFEGLTVGVDTACLVACDDLGFCDTTYLIVLTQDTIVTPPEGFPPIAFTDNSTTNQNQTVSICILSNDILNDTTVSVTVVMQPENGTVIFDNTDSCFLFTPTLDYCDDLVPETFTYAICNAYGCDTAMVTLLIQCDTTPTPPSDTLIIYNGFSPNGDGANNFFHINGIQNYPDNELWIYNRWGNEVYRRKGYLNDWDGTWNGKDLPDGTYFYYLKLNSSRQPNPYKGWLQIFR